MGITPPTHGRNGGRVASGRLERSLASTAIRRTSPAVPRTVSPRSLTPIHPFPGAAIWFLAPSLTGMEALRSVRMRPPPFPRRVSSRILTAAANDPTLTDPSHTQLARVRTELGLLVGRFPAIPQASVIVAGVSPTSGRLVDDVCGVTVGVEGGGTLPDCRRCGVHEGWRYLPQ